MPVLVTLGGIALGAGIGGAWLTTRGGPLGMFGGRGTNILVANNTGEDITFDQGSAACEWGRYDPAAPTTPLPGKAEDGTMSWYKFGTDSNGASASCGGKFVSSGGTEYSFYSYNPYVGNNHVNHSPNVSVFDALGHPEGSEQYDIGGFVNVVQLRLD